MPLFQGDHYFLEQQIIRLEHAGNGEPFLSAMLMITPEYLNRLTTGIKHKPDYNVHFPAKLITTQLSWDDLVLSPEVADEIENMMVWLEYSESILQQWDLGRTLKPGYRALLVTDR